MGKKKVREGVLITLQRVLMTLQRVKNRQFALEGHTGDKGGCTGAGTERRCRLARHRHWNAHDNKKRALVITVADSELPL